MIGCFLDTIIIVSVTVFFLKLALKGQLTPEQTATFLVGVVVLVALTRILRLSIGRLLFRVGLPVISLLAFAFAVGGDDTDLVISVIAYILTLVTVLVGIYIMIAGPFLKK